MKVKQLIKKLQKQSPEADVEICLFPSGKQKNNRSNNMKKFLVTVRKFIKNILHDSKAASFSTQFILFFIVATLTVILCIIAGWIHSFFFSSKDLQNILITTHKSYFDFCLTSGAVILGVLFIISLIARFMYAVVKSIIYFAKWVITIWENTITYVNNPDSKDDPLYHLRKNK